MTYEPSQGAQPVEGSDVDGGSGGLWRRAWLPALLGLFVGSAAFVVMSGRDPSYETCAYLRINSGPVDQAVLGLPAAEKPITNLITETAGEIEQRRVATRAVAYLGRTPIDNPADLLDAIAAKPDPNTGLIGVCGKAGTPRQAQRVANATSRAVVDLNREDQKRKIRAARRELGVLQRARIAALRRQGGTDEQLADTIQEGREQLERLTLAERINTDSISVSSPAPLPGGAAGIPTSAIGLLGFILGAALGGVILLARALTDRRVRTRRELARIAGVPVLASVRRRRTLKRRRPLGELRRREAEPFRLLLARLCNATSAEDRKAILITSVEDDGAGGSVAWYLGATAAAAGARVLLLEADADRPSAVEDSGGRPAGVTDVLTGHRRLDEVVFHVAADDRHAVDVVSPGMHNGAAHLSRAAVEDLVAQARTDYDHVFLDTPPVTDEDAVPFVRQAEGAVLVYRAGGADRDTLRAACGQLAAAGTPLLGVVAVGFVR